MKKSINTKEYKSEYRILKSPEEIKKLHEKALSSAYRQTYHIQPVSGLLNDPNGFVYQKGKWHLFYQWCPWGAFHGMKHWYQISSDDLITWKNKGVFLRPNTYFDNRGVFSGSALVKDDDIYLYYTGIHGDQTTDMMASTCIAKLKEDGRSQKFSAPLFGPNPEYTREQRDPKILFDHNTNKYYILMGGQTKDLKGCILVYESEKHNSGWHFKGQLKVPGYEDFGSMWECPSLERISNQDVLIFCPQNLHLEDHGQGTNHNGYLIGSMDFNTLTFTPEGTFGLLDFGFDSYAAQCAANLDDDSKAILIAWMGLPGGTYPTDQEEWSGCLTLPRELTIRHKRLIQRPLPQILSLRGNRINPGLGILPAATEILIATYPQDFNMRLCCKGDGSGGILIDYNDKTQVFTMDRSGMTNRFNQEIGEVRSRILEHGLTSLRIFIDNSSIEIFVNDGDAVFSSRIFPEMNEHNYIVNECRSLHIYEMHSGIKESLVV
ncbi:MAG: sucrose-6-phosphate hydrolase [Eubacterium sp.]|nr:sucrose-6-phosphate hydrolase [Eubacterium sp.]